MSAKQYVCSKVQTQGKLDQEDVKSTTKEGSRAAEHSSVEESVSSTIGGEGIPLKVKIAFIWWSRSPFAEN